ncbi:MAG: DUF2516 family protein [Actinomycetia bacterium]|nr:DUF2516 family protein [Actinomycetes bacterium]
MDFWRFQNLISTVLGVLVLGLGIWAFVDCLRRPQNYFPYVERKSKSLWLILTGVGAAVAIVVVADPLNIFGIASIVISLIYLFDLRPKFDQIKGGTRY